jgi:uncharacterized protein with PIN domain
VIDTSALLVILKVEVEPEAEALIARLSQAGPRRLSTATVLETRLVIERQIDAAGQAELDRLLAAAAITTAPLGETHLHWELVD